MLANPGKAKVSSSLQ